MQTKIQHFDPLCKAQNKPVVDSSNVPPLLDTLAQLQTTNGSKASRSTDDGKIRIQKRAKSKYFTNHLAIRLADLHTRLEKYYRNAYYCNSVLLQDNKTITAKYCNTRICNNCNRIRTAKLINGYHDVLSRLNDPYFVTLTIPNVTGDLLCHTMQEMLYGFVIIKNRIYKDSKRKGTPILKGIRKIECTANLITQTYHPHFHCIIEGEKMAHNLVRYWLIHFPDSNPLAQDTRKADSNSIKELFKYVTKIIIKSPLGKGYRSISIKALDVIMTAMYGKRTFQTFGGIKKVSEDVEKIDRQEYEFLSDTPEYESVVMWIWNDKLTDWFNIMTGELLSGFKPNETLKTLIKSMDT